MESDRVFEKEDRTGVEYERRFTAFKNEGLVFAYCAFVHYAFGEAR